MNATRTIVVGYDGSPAARAAVEAAIHRTGSEGNLILVHAYQVPPDYMGEPYYQDMLDHEATRSQDAMRELARTCDGLDDVVHETELLSGDPADAILKVADVRHADEIVLGSRGRGRLRSWLLGSVAQRVIHGARCPVLVMPERMLEGRAEGADRTAAAAA